MGKAPFERIVSLVDRKRIFQKKLDDRTSFVCRLPDGAMVEFSPIATVGEIHLLGKVDRKIVADTKTKSVTVMFFVGKQRYFLRTRIAFSQSGWVLQNSTDFYHLNRRESFRVDVPSDITLSLNVIMVDKTACQTTTRIVDFSAGGVLIRWPGVPAIQPGSRVRGQIIWFKSRAIPIACEVRHLPKRGFAGLQFVDLDAVSSNRFRMMSIELQQLVNFGK